jgi:hypothetical protein
MSGMFIDAAVAGHLGHRVLHPARQLHRVRLKCSRRLLGQRVTHRAPVANPVMALLSGCPEKDSPFSPV